jgi:L-ribulose-5-phosphate 3-epimerase
MQMKQITYIFLTVIILFTAILGCSNKQTTPKWKLGIQTYTFHKFTLMETLQKTRQLGVRYIEAFTFQEMGKGFPDSTYLNFDMSMESKALLKTELAKYNITLFACGVVSYNDESDWRKFFEFAKEMGIKQVSAEPKLEDLDMVEKLANEFNIEVAIHNHPNPSIYANPEVLLKALEGRSNLIGVCADIGHWKRVGADPLETLKRFKGRLKIIHLKDLNDKMEDATWGTGVLPVKEVVNELILQDFNGLISVEYENFGSSQMDDIVKSLSYFNGLIK